MTSHRAGNVADAERAYREILRAEPNHAEALHLLGLLHFQRGELDDAAALIAQALEHAPAHAAARLNFTKVLTALGRREEAVAELEAFVADYPSNAQAWIDLGNLRWSLGKIDAALSDYEQALRLDPASSAAQENAATALLTLADRFRESGHYDEALRVCERALSLVNSTQARIVRGQILCATHHLAEARAEFEHALALAPDSADALRAYGSHLSVMGEAAASIGALEKAASIAPHDVRAHFSLAVSYLLSGRYDEGWREFAWRRRDDRLKQEFRYESYPAWDGKRFDGRRLLISREQGLGDELFLARYFEKAASLGGETIVEASPSLLRLFRQSFPNLVLTDASLGAFELRADDLQIPAFSLPGLFGVRYPEAPDGPYLTVSKEAVEGWRRHIPADARRRNAGIVWQGGTLHRLDHLRSVALAAFAPLFESFDDIRWFSLQKGRGESELRNSPYQRFITDLAPKLDDFSETAAAVSLLDLVVTVDTSVAHLAGALGKTVWLLAGAGTDWRWGIDGQTTGWYPSMRIFRQSTPGDWASAVEKVAVAL
ncbi:MAG TPA: tetratricopeptide repeat protein [Candidatus Aquilonibacter sp.]|nr:tetratricopeptide repeat protein [Candidatus Aquilonibacter sp.]